MIEPTVAMTVISSNHAAVPCGSALMYRSRRDTQASSPPSTAMTVSSQVYAKTVRAPTAGVTGGGSETCCGGVLGSERSDRVGRVSPASWRAARLWASTRWDRSPGSFRAHGDVEATSPTQLDDGSQSVRLAFWVRDRSPIRTIAPR